MDNERVFYAFLWSNFRNNLIWIKQLKESLVADKWTKTQSCSAVVYNADYFSLLQTAISRFPFDQYSSLIHRWTPYVSRTLHCDPRANTSSTNNSVRHYCHGHAEIFTFYCQSIRFSSVLIHFNLRCTIVPYLKLDSFQPLYFHCSFQSQAIYMAKTITLLWFSVTLVKETQAIFTFDPISIF